MTLDIERFGVPADLAQTAHITADKYQTLYARSIADPSGFGATWPSVWIG